MDVRSRRGSGSSDRGAATLEREHFAKFGRWLKETGLPAAAILEGGYSDDLPVLVEAFLVEWNV